MCLRNIGFFQNCMALKHKTVIFRMQLRVPFTYSDCPLVTSVYCVGGYAWRKWRVLDRMIGFIGTSVTSSLNHTYNAISLLHTYSSPLHTHQDSPSSLVVSRQRISAQKPALQINMKSSFYFVYNHSVLLCSLRTCSILIFVLSTELNWTALI
jgi:hypothetical protein